MTYISGGGLYRPAALDARRQKQRVEDFAGPLADDMTISDAARHLGMSRQWSSRVFGQLRSGLGKQAI